MPFSEAQITHAIEQGLRRVSTFDNPRVLRIRCQDVVWYGLSANTFARCGANIIADGKERLAELVIKRWAPGGPTDVDIGIDPLPRESLAFEAASLALIRYLRELKSHLWRCWMIQNRMIIGWSFTMSRPS